MILRFDPVYINYNIISFLITYVFIASFLYISSISIIVFNLINVVIDRGTRCYNLIVLNKALALIFWGLDITWPLIFRPILIRALLKQKTCT